MFTLTIYFAAEDDKVITIEDHEAAWALWRTLQDAGWSVRLDEDGATVADPRSTILRTPPRSAP